MNAQMQKDSVATEEKKNKKRQHSAALWILLAIVLFLFLLSTIVLGYQLYKLATRDQYILDLGMGKMEGSVELFRIEYANASGEITVQGVNAENVVAPGTTVSYDLRLRNNDDVVIDFIMAPIVEFLTEDPVPVEFKIMDDYGNYILGDENTWAASDGMNRLNHKGTIHPGEVFTYHVSWQWVFEAAEAQDDYDTYLGTQGGEILPGVRVAISTEAMANPSPANPTVHTMHLLGNGFGCCWCCYLVWILLLICLLMLLRISGLQRKLHKQEDSLKEYEEVLTRHGLLVNGELIDDEKIIL